MMQQLQNIRMSTVRWLGRHLAVDLDIGVLTISEYNQIMSILKSLAKNGTPSEPVKPKLLTVENVADLLSISKSQFRALEAEGKLPFKRRMIGASVRYLNAEVLDYMQNGSLTEDDGATLPERKIAEKPVRNCRNDDGCIESDINDTEKGGKEKPTGKYMKKG